MSSPRPGGLTTMADIAVGAGLRRTDIPALCAELAGLIRDGPGGVVDCDVAGATANLITVEALGRLRLTARRYGYRLAIRNTRPALRELIIMLGLGAPLLSAQPLRQPEQWEQPGGVEEVVD